MPAGPTAKDHVVLLDRLDVASLIDGAGLHHALDAGRALLAALGQAAQGNRGIRGHQLQHAVQLAVMELHAVAPQMLIVGENALNPGDASG